jgi:hypothetical protein
MEIHAAFTAPGSMTQPAAGEGNAYVTLPTTRACESHSLTSTLTALPKRAKKIRSVTFLLDGRPVATVKKPAAGQAMAVPVPDDKAAELTAVVTVRTHSHRHHHHHHHDRTKTKTVSVTAGYEACTA